MLVGTELKGELARIHPARACCRVAELAGLLHGDTAVRPDDASQPTDRSSSVELLTLDPATARTAVSLAAPASASGASEVAAAGTRTRHTSAGRQRLRVAIDASAAAVWSWAAAPTCDRRAFLRGVLLASGSISASRTGLHVEFVFRSAERAEELRARLRDSDVRSATLTRRGRRVVYIKGRDEIATLLRLTGANRGVLDLEAASVGREVRNRLNRLLNAEEANLRRTVAAAERQVSAIRRLAGAGVLEMLSGALRETAAARLRRPEADLDELAGSLGVSRSAVNHRLRRLSELADELAGDVADAERRPAARAHATRRR